MLRRLRRSSASGELGRRRERHLRRVLGIAHSFDFRPENGAPPAEGSAWLGEPGRSSFRSSPRALAGFFSSGELVCNLRAVLSNSNREGCRHCFRFRFAPTLVDRQSRAERSRRGEEPAVDAAAAVIGEAEQGLLPKSLVRDGQRRRRFMRQISLRHSGLFSDAAPGSLALF